MKVAEISYRSIKGYDKWYRMFMGIASDLEKYEDGVIYLKISNTEKHLPSSYATAIKFARHWVSWNKELASAQGFVVSFYSYRAKLNSSLLVATFSGILA